MSHCHLSVTIWIGSSDHIAGRPQSRTPPLNASARAAAGSAVVARHRDQKRIDKKEDKINIYSEGSADICDYSRIGSSNLHLEIGYQP